jgi:hypothetical protein
VATNRRLAEEDGIDFYPTPAWCVDALCHYEKFEGTILEPACGDGAICKALVDNGVDSFTITASDLYSHGYGASGIDFLEYPIPVDNIITNPPYHIANDFTKTAIRLANKKVALLMRLAFLEGQERYETLFSETPPARVLVFSERITMYKKYAQDKKGSGTTAYAWFIFDKDVKDKSTKIIWIKPGFKSAAHL